MCSEMDSPLHSTRESTPLTPLSCAHSSSSVIPVSGQHSCIVPVDLKDHNYCKKMIKPRACRKEMCSSHPRKRRLSPASPPRNSVPRSAISPDDLPVASARPPSPQLCSTSDLEEPLKIHNHSVEDYQKIYHEVVDNMISSKKGRPRPYSLELGRKIKQKLWERLNRPMVMSSINHDGLQQIDMVYGQEEKPPQYDTDASGKLTPQHSPRKKLKTRD